MLQNKHDEDSYKDPVRRSDDNLKHPLLTSGCKSKLQFEYPGALSLFQEAQTCSLIYHKIRPQILCVTGKGCGVTWCTDLSSNLTRLGI